MDEMWDRFQELTKDFYALKDELKENAPETYKRLTEDMESMLNEMEEMYNYYSQ